MFVPTWSKCNRLSTWLDCQRHLPIVGDCWIWSGQGTHRGEHHRWSPHWCDKEARGCWCGFAVFGMLGVIWGVSLVEPLCLVYGDVNGKSPFLPINCGIDFGKPRKSEDDVLFFIVLTVFIYQKMLSDRWTIICIIACHVDVSLGGCNNWGYLNCIKEMIPAWFRISNMGAVSMYLGIEIEQNCTTGEVWIHEESYNVYLCDKYWLCDTNPASLPMSPNHLFGQRAILTFLTSACLLHDCQGTHLSHHL